jgi:50S ribosomal subunit-associated GTPase HflX
LLLHTLALDRRQDVVLVSAATGEGLDRLTSCVAARLDACSALVDVSVPLADGKSLAAVRRVGAMLEQQIIDTELVRMRLRISAGALGGLRRAVSDAVRFERVAGPPNAHSGETEQDADRAVQR